MLSAIRASIDVWDLLVWTYRTQRVTFASAVSLHQIERQALGHEPRGRSADGVALLVDRGDIGCTIDGGGPLRGVAQAVHEDAELVHAAVCRTPWARYVIQVATRGERPEPCTDVPRPVRVPMVGPGSYDPHTGALRPKVVSDWHSIPADMPADAEYGWLPVPGERRIAQLRAQGEKVRRYEPGWHYSEDGSAVFAPFCPLVYSPDPEWIEDENRDYARWHATMTELEPRLRAVTLKRWRVSGFKARAPLTNPK